MLENFYRARGIPILILSLLHAILAIIKCKHLNSIANQQQLYSQFIVGKFTKLDAE